jgi:hypothetical protein
LTSVIVALSLVGCSLGANGSSGGNAPSVPTGLKWTASTATSVSLSWTASSGATQYQVYSDTSSTGSFSTLVYSGTATSCTDTTNLGTAPSESFYEILATNSAGSSFLSAPAIPAWTVGTIDWLGLNSGGQNWDCYLTDDASNYNTVNFYVGPSSLTLNGPEVSAAVELVSGCGSEDYGMVFAYSDANNYWSFVINTSGENAGDFAIRHISGGSVQWDSGYIKSGGLLNLGFGVTNILTVQYVYTTTGAGGLNKPYYLNFYLNGYEYPCYYCWSPTPFPISTNEATGCYAAVEASPPEDFPFVPYIILFQQISSTTSSPGNAASAIGGSALFIDKKLNGAESSNPNQMKSPKLR